MVAYPSYRRWSSASPRRSALVAPQRPVRAGVPCARYGAPVASEVVVGSASNLAVDERDGLQCLDVEQGIRDQERSRVEMPQHVADAVDQPYPEHMLPSADVRREGRFPDLHAERRVQIVQRPGVTTVPLEPSRSQRERLRLMLVGSIALSVRTKARLVPNPSYPRVLERKASCVSSPTS
ncbi:hypothetical protein NKDENANG_03638 [Candidatus Entotheonellaceae bacterium PAL068K]